MEPIPDIVIIEGKNDWYTFKYFSQISNKDPKINFYPGAGATNLYDIIRLYLAWGKNFLVILDGDETGKLYKTKYTNTFGKLIENKIFTLYDIFQSEFEAEDLIIDDDKKNIICEIFGEEVYDNLNKNLKETLNKAMRARRGCRPRGRETENIRNFYTIAIIIFPYNHVYIMHFFQEQLCRLVAHRQISSLLR